jgi:hypothetical protein
VCTGALSVLLPERSGIPCAFGGPVVRDSLLTLGSVVDRAGNELQCAIPVGGTPVDTHACVWTRPPKRYTQAIQPIKKDRLKFGG